LKILRDLKDFGYARVSDYLRTSNLGSRELALVLNSRVILDLLVYIGVYNYLVVQIHVRTKGKKKKWYMDSHIGYFSCSYKAEKLSPAGMGF
jgi:hypothetical protein